MASPIVRALLGVCFVAFVVATFHCSIEHIPHIYCNVKDDCDQAPYTACDVAHHTCIVDADGGMPGDMPELAGPDMFCTSSASCTDDAPICAVMRCRACMDSSDDAQCVAHNAKTPRCNAPSGRCVECLASPDCPSATPVCNTTAFTCRKCAAHSECTSGICKSDGTCAAVAEIAYVNNGSGACPGSGTQAMPYCEISYAVSNSSKSYILVSPSATSYATLSFAPTATALGPLTIVGPAGRGAAMKASVSSTANLTPAVAFTTTAVPLTVTIDGLDIAGANGGPASQGVQCNQTGAATATVVIKNSTIHNSGKEGINSSGCTLTVDGNLIFSNSNEGIKLTGTTYVITNNLIFANGTVVGGLPGVTIDSASTGTFAFDTVAQNGGSATIEGGIACPNTGSAFKLIEESIVAQNQHNPATNGTQFVGKCMLQSVVTGPDSFTGAIQSAPAFVSMADFHLDVGAGLTANQACCIDKIATPTTPNADHDVDRGPRPKVAGGKLDIGAHEAQ